MIDNNELYNSVGENGGNIQSNIPDNTSYFEYSYAEVFKSISNKKRIKKAAVITGLPLLIVFLVSDYWINLLLLFTDSIGIERTKISEFFSISVIRDTLQIVLSTIMFVIPFAIASKFAKNITNDVFAFNKPKKHTFFPYFIVGFSFCMFANILTALASDVFSSFGVDYNVNFGESDSSLYGIVLAIISTAIIPGLVEEFACRGLLLGTLLPFGEGFAVLSSALLFGVMHGNFEQMPFAFLVGLILGFVRVKTGSLWICILIHFSNNMFSLVNSYLVKILPINICNIIYSVFVAIIFIFGIFSFFKLERQEDFLSLDAGNTDIKEKNKYSWYFTSPIIIITILMYVIKSFSYFR